MAEASQQMRGNPVSYWVAVLVFFTAVIYFLGLDARYLSGGVEMRNAGIAAELTISHQWAVPRLNGDYCTDAPPLFHWIGGAVMRTLGRNPFAAKLPAALFGFCAVLGVFAFGRRLKFSLAASFIGAAALAASFRFFEASRACDSTTMSAALALWALYGFYSMVQAERLRYRMRWFLFYAAMMSLLGLGFGLNGLLLGAGIPLVWLLVCNLVCGKYRKPVWYGAIGGGLFLALLMALAWLLSVAQIGDDAVAGWRGFFSLRHVETLNVRGIIGFFSPWGVLVLLGLIFGLQAINRNPGAGERYFLVLALFLVPLILGMPVTAYAGAGLLVATGIGLFMEQIDVRQFAASRPLRITGKILGWLVILCVPGVMLAAIITSPYAVGLFEWFILLGPLCFVTAIVCWLRKSPRSHGIAMLAAVAGILLAFDTCVTPFANSRDSLRDVFRSAEANLRTVKNSELYFYRVFSDEVRGAALYYLGRRVPILDREEELKGLERMQAQAFILSGNKESGFEGIGMPRKLRMDGAVVELGLYQLAKVKYNYAGGL